MKQNGVIIYRISDLKRFFDFFSFWNSQNEFFELVMPSGSIDDFFFDTELEKTCCAVFARCRRRYDNIWATVKFGENGSEFISSVSDNCRQRILYPKIWQLSREQADFYKRLEAIIMDRYTLMALFSLYMMIGHMPDEIELKNVLEIISENESDFSNRVVVLKKDEKLPAYDILESPEFPLEIKTLVNMSVVPVIVALDRGGKECAWHTLNPNECINGIFHNGKCYRMLARKAEGDGYYYELLFNDRTHGTDLRMTDVMSGKTKIKSDIVSFIVDDSGYAYVDESGKYNVSRHSGIRNRLQIADKYINGKVLAFINDGLNDQVYIVTTDDII